MQKYATAIVLAGLLVAARNGFAADSFEAVGERMTRFNLTPTREVFNAIQDGIKSHLRKFKAEEKENGTATLAAVFLARVSEKYKYPLFDIGNLDDTARSIAANDGSELSNYVHDDSQLDPSKLDIWWISYFATGDTRYLDNILAQVGDVKLQPGVERKLLVHSANWSVASNCEQHPEILAYVESVLAQDPAPANSDALREVVARVGKHDG